MKIRIYHTHFGCDCGCCGHVLEKTDDAGKVITRLVFDHASGDSEEDKRYFGLEQVQTNFGLSDALFVDWPSCEILHFDQCAG
jgi:hypothetical protein